jgi:isochorismate pyruvate lyase
MQITDQAALDRLRGEIDVIDHELVAIIGRRAAVVRQVVRLKRDEDAARSPQRVEQVVANVRRIAEDAGAPPDVVEATYRALIASLTDMQLEHLRAGNGSPTTR